MASSVARMPSEDWRDPNRIGAGVFSAHAAFGKPLNVRVRDSLRARVPFLATTTTTVTSSSSSSSAPVKEERDVSCRRAEPASATAASAEEKRGQSRILDWWAARQAREIVTTIERQDQEAEISALTTVSQPVSARAATFLRDTTFSQPGSARAATCIRDTSPARSESSCGGGGGGGGSIDLPPSVRASSLIQMWRELEAEAGLTPTPRASANANANANAGGGNAGLVSTAISLTEEPSGCSDVCDESETCGDWESDVTALSEPNSTSLPESERGRVGNIVRMLVMGSRMQSSEAFWSEETEASYRENSVWDHGGSRGSLTLLRVRRRREVEDLLARMEQERKRELTTLAERQPVSRFSQRSRIQSLLRLKFLRRETNMWDQHRPVSTPLELNQLQNRPTILLLRERFNDRGQGNQQDGCEVSTMKSSDRFHVQLPNNTQDPCCSALAENQFTNDNNHYQEVLSARDSESTLPELSSPQARSEDLQGESQISNVTWEERISQVNSLDWQIPLDSPTFENWQDEAATEEQESYAHQDVPNPETTWLSCPSNSWRGWEASNQATRHNLVENFPDNVEIRELLERRRVSISLASDFRDRMDRLILSFLRRQGQSSDDENIGEDHEDQAVWRQFEQYDDADKVASSSSLISLPYHALQRSDDWQHTSSVCHSSQHLHEMDVPHDLRCNIAHLHHEISELRKLVESCMDCQENLQHTIKEEVSAAVRQSFRIENRSHSSKRAPTRKGNCCICYDMQVDSLLYRCGHMCTCFKCGHELQWSSGRCPICRAPIDDVVRAYPNS